MRYAARVQLRDLGEFGLIERIARRASRSARAALRSSRASTFASATKIPA
jgi:hypothetical protein